MDARTEQKRENSQVAKQDVHRAYIRMSARLTVACALCVVQVVKQVLADDAKSGKLAQRRERERASMAVAAMKKELKAVGKDVGKDVSKEERKEEKKQAQALAQAPMQSERKAPKLQAKPAAARTASPSKPKDGTCRSPARE
jgi:hypothetical protein